jgi:nucleotide-binding universal stress UspA family protein
MDNDLGTLKADFSLPSREGYLHLDCGANKMKILVPVDETNRYRSVLKLIDRLRFPSVEVHFLHAIAPVVGYDATFAAIAAVNGAELADLEHNDTSERLSEAARRASQLGFAATWSLEFGYPATVIEAKADELGADLVALAASTKSPFERLFTGCVAIGVAENSKHNLLVVRNEKQGSDKVKAIYATDHSALSEEGLNRLLGWGVLGLDHVEVLTAYQEAKRIDKTSLLTAEAGQAEPCSQCEKARAIAARFEEKGIDAHARCLKGSAADVIRQTLGLTGAQLLILSAKEHGFWKSLTGSTSIHEIANEPCSILVLRPSLVAQKVLA